MSVHTFDLGDRVSIFQLTHSGQLINEGVADVVEILDVDEYYLVRFDNEEPVHRFVDVQGQDDPDGYCWDFNKKINKA